MEREISSRVQIYSVLTIACSISPVPTENRLDKIAEAKHIRVDWKQPESWALSGAGTGPQEARMAEPLQGHHKYARVQDLGAGSFGIVQLAVNRSAWLYFLAVTSPTADTHKRCKLTSYAKLSIAY